MNSELGWSTEKPTKPGMYWLARRDGHMVPWLASLREVKMMPEYWFEHHMTYGPIPGTEAPPERPTLESGDQSCSQ